MSVRPRYASKILEGEKTVELRRRFPTIDAVGATALIYSSSPVRAVVGYAQIKEVLELPISQIWKEFGEAACVSKKELYEYFIDRTRGYCIFLQNPKTLALKLTAADLLDEFGFVPPQSFRYVDEGYNSLLSDERLQTSYRHKRRHRA